MFVFELFSRTFNSGVRFYAMIPSSGRDEKEKCKSNND